MSTRYTVDVPTEEGQTCVIDVEHLDDPYTADAYRVQFSGELLDQSPEALTAAVQMAMLTIRADRPHTAGRRHLTAASHRQETR